MKDSCANLLKYILLLVPFEGWTEHALKEAGKKAGLDAIQIKRCFPKGPIDAIQAFYTACDEDLAHAFSTEALAKLRMPERIEKLIDARLHYWQQHRESLRRAQAVHALPWNIPQSYKLLYGSVDQMWKLAGDHSTDFSFYTKRLTLATLYSSTLLFWLNDNSEHYKDTKEFLKRRLKNIGDFGKWKKNLTDKLGLPKAR
jgi:ubiquinone biosynthesis protein COQ9